MIDNDIPGPGKFEGNASLEISEALYSLCGESLFDDQFGDVSTSWWEALFLNVTPIGGRTRSYVVTENEQGFFSYVEFESASDAQERFDADYWYWYEMT